MKKLHQQQFLRFESSTGLQKLLDTTNECVRSLKVLNRPIEHCDDFLIYLVVERMDPSSRREWAKTLTGTVPPDYKDLTTFLELHIRGLVASGQIRKPYHSGLADDGSRRSSSHSSSSQSSQSSQSSSSSHTSSSSHPSSTDSPCVVCGADHPLSHCAEFRAMSPSDRGNVVTNNSLCYNCLRNHNVKDCKVEQKCKKCQKPHHTMIHDYSSQKSRYHQNNSSKKQNQASNSSVNVNSLFINYLPHQVILKTALAKVKDSLGVNRIVRVVLDDGAEGTIMTESCASALGLNRHSVDISITGVSSTPAAQATSLIKLSLSSLSEDSSVNLEALVVPRVTGHLPKQYCDSSNWSHLHNLPLADPKFNVPAPVDILIGADATGLIIKEGIRLGRHNEPTAQNTIFGWVVCGKAKANFHNVISINVVEMDSLVKRFIELEEVPHASTWTEEEKACEDHFKQNYSRNEEGRFVVRLPIKKNTVELGASKAKAVSRLMQMERKIQKQPNFREEYCKFMHEYESLGHMVRVPPLSSYSNPHFYLPHHFVLKEDSSTTKFRVVFDGSASTSSSMSLNNILMVGPTIQDDIFSILLRFRFHLIAMKADISKMYRQFLVHPDDRNLQRIVWRDFPNQQIQEFQLTTVTYGTSSAPFLATRCLKQLSEDVESTFPLASKALGEDMYVDDYMGGQNTIDSAIKLYHQMNQAAKSARMDFAKWACSSPDVLKVIPEELRESNSALSFDSSASVKALGVIWNPASDQFLFNVQPPSQSKALTKRKLLSDLAKVFDPLGWLSPTTIQAKIIFQELWKQPYDWNATAPKAIQDTWNQYLSDMNSLSSLRIPRCVIKTEIISQEIHGFCDASIKAYAAAIYLRCIRSDGTVFTNLLTSKTRVAPIKQVSLPRLELCGALLLSELLSSVKISINIDCLVSAWTDSTIVLGWLSSYPGRWQTFVANRVAKIQESVPVSQWFHVRSEDNPADLPSRGIPAQELISSSLWWNGPSWLQDNVSSFPPYQHDGSSSLPEAKKIQIHVGFTQIEETLLSKYSSLLKLQRATAWLLRYLNYLKKDVKKGPLLPSELRSALMFWINKIQQQSFPDEIQDLRKQGRVHRSSKLHQLTPFLDNHGFLRVGGRISNSNVQEDVKHPLIIPHNQVLTKLIIHDCHLATMHGGFKLVFATLQQRYFIIRGQTTVRHLIRKCVTCRKTRGTLMQQLMGNLPSPRVNYQRPFLHVGVDYAGPFSITPFRARGQKSFKCYFAIFVCLATKAVHLEVVTDLTSEAFIGSFKRFTSRRGKPSNLYSDCGTNFTGADKELTLLVEQFNNEAISKSLAEQGTTWHFNPPSAPHQGGLWEAGVKSVKYHLRRVVGQTILSLEEFQTILCQVEACLNSRPICALSNDPDDLGALTPGHFLIGAPFTAIPEPDLTPLKDNQLSRWQLTQKIFQHFWKRWHEEYLTNLQQRYKWTIKKPNVQIGDLVTIKDDNLPPLKWKMGRVINVHSGPDNCVRVVTVKTQSGEMERPIVKLCPILFKNEQ